MALFKYSANYNYQFGYLISYYDKNYGIITIETSFIGCAPGHPSMQRALDLLVDNTIVERQELYDYWVYNHKCFSKSNWLPILVTGPGLLTVAFAQTMD